MYWMDLARARERLIENKNDRVEELENKVKELSDFIDQVNAKVESMRIQKNGKRKEKKKEETNSTLSIEVREKIKKEWENFKKSLEYHKKYEPSYSTHVTHIIFTEDKNIEEAR